MGKGLAIPIIAAVLGATGMHIASGIVAKKEQDKKKVVLFSMAEKDLKKFNEQIEQSGAAGEVYCEKGIISNHPKRVYCSGGTGGFLVDESIDIDVAEGERVLATRVE